MRCLAGFGHDLRYAWRSLRQSPGFAATVIPSSALGIGACSTIFGIANFALFTGLPVAEPERLVSVSGANPRKSGQTLAYPVYEELTRARSFEGVAALFPMVPGAFAAMAGNDAQTPGRYWGALVTENFFDVVQVPFTAGRGFIAGGRDRAIVLSHSLWRSRFGEDRSLIGKTIRWNGKPATVAGVTAPGFRGTEALLNAEFWIPFSMLNDVASLAGKGPHFVFGRQWLFAIGRLREGITYTSARAELGASRSAWKNCMNRKWAAVWSWTGRAPSPPRFARL